MNREFEVHMLNETGKAKAQAIAAAFDRCLDSLVELCPPGRELAVTRTKLEEACFFAKKAMASDPDNCVAGTIKAQNEAAQKAEYEKRASFTGRHFPPGTPGVPPERIIK